MYQCEFLCRFKLDRGWVSRDWRTDYNLEEILCVLPLSQDREYNPAAVMVDKVVQVGYGEGAGVNFCDEVL